MTTATNVYAWASLAGYDLLQHSGDFTPYPEDFVPGTFEGWREDPALRSEILDAGYAQNGFYARTFVLPGSTDVIVSFRGTDGGEDYLNWLGSPNRRCSPSSTMLFAMSRRSFRLRR
jgi:hypothetical protein